MRMKNFCISKFEFSIALLPLTDDIAVVCAVMTNLMKPLIINKAIVIAERIQCIFFLPPTTS